jgi:hypothetical protein
MRRNSEGVPLWEWDVTVTLWSDKVKDKIKVTTTVYHTVEALAEDKGAKEIEEALGLNFDDWNWKCEARMSEDSLHDYNTSTLTLADVINYNSDISE